MKNASIFISMNRFGYAILEELLDAKVPISHIYTLHPSRALRISDYKDFRPLAKRYNIPLTHVRNINDECADIRKKKPLYIFVCGWSQLLGPELLTVPLHGVIGSHPSLLPKNRGRAVIPWHILNREKKGGLSFFYIDEGCDSGPLIAQKDFRITSKMTATNYYDRITVIGRTFVRRYAARLRRGERLAAHAQGRGATYLAKRTFEDGVIDWTQDVRTVERQVRALTEPYPGAWTTFKETLIIDAARAVRGAKTAKPGTVVSRDARGIVVQTGKGRLRITAARSQGRAFKFSRIHVGARLGAPVHL